MGNLLDKHFHLRKRPKNSTPKCPWMSRGLDQCNTYEGEGRISVVRGKPIVLSFYIINFDS